MRKLSLFMMVSLDGYVEAPGHDLSAFNGENEGFSSGASETDMLLFGHRTYEGMKFWSTPEGEKAAPEVARFISETPKIVVSHQSFDPGWKKVTVISADVPARIRQIKDQPGGTILIMGSNNLCVTLMQANLIDEFVIVVNPVVLSNGTPLFKGLPAKANLTLTDSRKYRSGAMQLTYVPTSG